MHLNEKYKLNNSNNDNNKSRKVKYSLQNTNASPVICLGRAEGLNCSRTTWPLWWSKPSQPKGCSGREPNDTVK